MSTKSLEDTIAIYEASEEILNGELAEATVDCTQIRELFDNTCFQVVYFREKRVANDAIVRSIV